MIELYCSNGCPFGGKESPCGQSPYSCPINEMYQENLQHRTGYKTCSHCSMISYGGGRFYPANLCGLCGHYCPACTAPKESPVP